MANKWTAEDVKKMFANPFYAINIDEELAEPHETIVSKEQWVETMAKTMLTDEDGNTLPSEQIEGSIKDGLHRILDCLEGGYIRG